MPSLPDCWIVAHRGARQEAPENTRAAFTAALAYPIDAIELDVQLSADDHLVIHHDWTLHRVARSNRRPAELTLTELKRIDWGGWFAPAFAGEPLPLLAPILKDLGQRTRWMIEIKVHPQDRGSDGAERLVKKLVGLLDRAAIGLPEDALHILCFDPELLLRTAALRPRWRLVLNLTNQGAAAIMKQPPAADHLWAVDVPIARLCAPMAAWAQRRALRVFTYTCNGPRQVRKAVDLGVDGIITDRPGWLCRLWQRPAL